MWKSNDKRTTKLRLKSRNGLSLVELIVVTFIIAIAASIAFPTYKIFQQRSKEKRLKKILTEVRAAINGTKSHSSNTDFEEGFRTVVRVKGIEIITNLAPDQEERKNFINFFVAKLGEGYGYPANPGDIFAKNPEANFMGVNLSYVDSHGDPHVFPGTNFGLGGILSLERPFYRSRPIHPFHDWYPTVDFAYIPASDTRGIECLTNASYTFDEWYAMNPDIDHPVLIGVKDIVSRGAGLALDGSNTDEW